MKNLQIPIAVPRHTAQPAVPVRIPAACEACLLEVCHLSIVQHLGRVRTHRVKPQAVFAQRCGGSNCLSTVAFGTKKVIARVVSPNVQSRPLTRVAGKMESHTNRAQAVGDVEGHKILREFREINSGLLSPAMGMSGLLRDDGSHLWRSLLTVEKDDSSTAKSQIHKASGVSREVRASHSTPSTGKPSHIQGRSGEGAGRSNQLQFASVSCWIG